jgi:hypothetical protein
MSTVKKEKKKTVVLGLSFLQMTVVLSLIHSIGSISGTKEVATKIKTLEKFC